MTIGTHAAERVGRYKLGADLVVGDRVSTWWKTEGARLLAFRPYDGQFVNVFDRVATFEAPSTSKGWIEVTIAFADSYEVMGCPCPRT